MTKEENLEMAGAAGNAASTVNQLNPCFCYAAIGPVNDYCQSPVTCNGIQFCISTGID
jgi:hypothetical protein